MHAPIRSLLQLGQGRVEAFCGHCADKVIALTCAEAEDLLEMLDYPVDRLIRHGVVHVVPSDDAPRICESSIFRRV